MQSADPFRLSASQESTLDVLRAMAAQFVVINHFLLVQNIATPRISISMLGVVIFFLLSGFLIANSALRDDLSRFDPAVFLVKRAARLYVCYIPALLFCAWAATVLSLPMLERTQGNEGLLPLLGNLLMLQDYPLFTILERGGLGSDRYVDTYLLAGPFWTLAIEFWIYVVFGLVLAIAAGARLSLPLQCLGAVGLPVVVYHAATGYGQCLTLVWVAGVGIWWLLRRLQAASLRHHALLGWQLMAVAFVLLALRISSRGFRAYDLQVALFVAVFMLGLLLAVRNVRFPDRLRAPVRLLAAISYPLYLSHYPVLYAFEAWGWAVNRPAAWAGVMLVTNIVALGFWLAFDRYYGQVADRVIGWLRPLGAAVARR